MFFCVQVVWTFGGTKKGLKKKKALPFRHCIVMLRASSALNKVMETPGKRGPRLGQITRKPAKRDLLSCQENITETDFLVGFGFSVFEAQLKLGREKGKTRSDLVVDVFLCLEGQNGPCRDSLKFRLISAYECNAHSRGDFPPSVKFSALPNLDVFKDAVSLSYSLHLYPSGLLCS